MSAIPTTASYSPWQHATAPGAVQTPDGADATSVPNPDFQHSDSQQLDSNDTSHEGLIQQGKQRAREAMAAAGLQPNSNNTNSPLNMSTSTPNAPNGATQQANGSRTPQLSRKRSRDGTQLPLSDAANADEPQHPHDEILLDRYIQRDLLHCATMNSHEEWLREEFIKKERLKEYNLREVAMRRRTDPGSIFGHGYSGYANGTTNGNSQIVYSANRGPPRGRRNRHLFVSRKDTTQQAEQHEELVPVRLDIELDKLRLRDTFTWNLHERVISQAMFTDYLLEDLRIPPEMLPEVSRQVKAELQDQIQNFYPHVIVEDGPLEPGRPFTDHKDEEMRIQIKLNINIGRIQLLDQFEWDINNPLNSPEEFARQMAWENALSGEFTTAIAHSIREQSQLYTKSLYLTNHCFDGRPIEDPEVHDAFLPGPLHSAFRPSAAQKEYAPYMYEISEAECERIETSMMREHRAQKRQLNRRGGPALPDLKDRQRTVRSLVVHSVIPGAVDRWETTGIPKTRRRSAKPGASRKPGGAGGVDGDLDSDDLESDDSGPESPAPSALTGGTARTRGMRGAASAATAALRAGFGRSQTPDSQLVSTPHGHDGSTRPRRSMLREESLAADDAEELIVKLKINKAKYKAFWEDYTAKRRRKEYPLSGYASQPAAAASLASPARTGSATPTTARGGPNTPNQTLPHHHTSTPQPNGGAGHSRSTSRHQPQQQQPTTSTQYDAKGGVTVETWPGPEDPAPAPPPWLTAAITSLRQRHPDDDFNPLMRAYIVSQTTDEIQKPPVPALQPGDLAPAPAPSSAAAANGEKLKIVFLPRIRCNDCPGKLYTASPLSVEDDFTVHLRNRNHRERVLARQRRERDGE